MDDSVDHSTSQCYNSVRRLHFELERRILHTVLNLGELNDTDTQVRDLILPSITEKIGQFVNSVLKTVNSLNKKGELSHLINISRGCSHAITKHSQDAVILCFELLVANPRHHAEDQ